MGLDTCDLTDCCDACLFCWCCTDTCTDCCVKGGNNNGSTSSSNQNKSQSKQKLLQRSEPMVASPDAAPPLFLSLPNPPPSPVSARMDR